MRVHEICAGAEARRTALRVRVSVRCGSHFFVNNIIETQRFSFSTEILTGTRRSNHHSHHHSH